MASLAEALRSEIAAALRKHAREQAQAAREASSGLHQELAALRRRVDTLERQLAQAHRPARSRARGPSNEGPNGQLRFSPKGFAKLRQRLGLSAAAMGALAGVTAQSVYKWEDGRARPRASQLQAIAAVRKLGKREAAARLEQMRAAPDARRA